jgi:glycosyltransferase involved in cell wall biosynthesis
MKQVSNGKKRISLLVISPGGLGQHYHGPAISLYRLLLTLVDRLNVDVIHGSPEQGEISPLRGKAIRTGTVSSGFLRSASYVLASIWFVIRYRKRYDAVLLATSSLLTLLPGSVAYLMGMSVISRAAAIAEVSTEKGGPLGVAVKKVLLRQATAYLAISEAIARALRKSLGKSARIHVIPNGVDTNRFSPGGGRKLSKFYAELGLESDALFCIVCVGAVCDRKGQLIIVESLTHLPDNVALLLVGPARDSKYLGKIREIVVTSGLGRRVIHVPFMKDVEHAYRDGDIFALPSRGEGMPNAMLEAMACGLVPIGSRISGIEDLVQDDCGRFVERDARSIAGAVRPYLEDRSLLKRQSKRARQIIEQTYAAPSVTDRFFALLSGMRPPE